MSVTVSDWCLGSQCDTGSSGWCTSEASYYAYSCDQIIQGRCTCRTISSTLSYCSLSPPFRVSELFGTYHILSQTGSSQVLGVYSAGYPVLAPDKPSLEVLNGAQNFLTRPQKNIFEIRSLGIRFRNHSSTTPFGPSSGIQAGVPQVAEKES